MPTIAVDRCRASRMDAVANRSNDDAMIVGRQRVKVILPPPRMRASASSIASGVSVGGIEIDAGKPVDLQIEVSPAARRVHHHGVAASVSTGPRVSGSRSAAESRSRYIVVFWWVLRIDAGTIGDTSPSTDAFSSACALRASGTTQIISRDCRICRTDIENGSLRDGRDRRKPSLSDLLPAARLVQPRR